VIAIFFILFPEQTIYIHNSNLILIKINVTKILPVAVVNVLLHVTLLN